MNWFQQNRFLGSFLAVLLCATLLSVCFLRHEKRAAEREGARLEMAIDELIRLRGSTPFPNEENLRRARVQTARYRESLLALENELKPMMFPKEPLQPNEFQARLRQAASDVIERARVRKVQLPENFNLGFDEYATSLPKSAAAPQLGRQLQAVAWIAKTIIDARADSLQSLARNGFPEERATPGPTGVGARSGRKPKTSEARARIVDSTAIDVAFSSSPAAARQILNQIAAAKAQTYIIRTLEVRNQADKGPERGDPGKPAATPALVLPPAPSGGAGKGQGIRFIVGTEHLNVWAKIEILRFNLPNMEGR